MNVHSIKDAPIRTLRGRPRVDDKRRLILDAALRVFAERGYHGTAVPEVAQAAKVSTGTLYHYFESKELLVNEVYRDAKTRLRATLLDTLPKLDPYQMDQGRAWFTALWDRLGAFAQAEPDAFRFLEMQDHTPYLDHESKQLELSVLAPLWLEGKRLTDRAGAASDAPPVDVAIALLWGAFVGLIKASRLGYLALDETSLARAGAACWRMIAPQMPRAASSTSRASHEPAPQRAREPDAPSAITRSRAPLAPTAATRSARRGALPLGAASTTSPRNPDALSAAREDALPLGRSRHEPASSTSRASHGPAPQRAREPDAPAAITRSRAPVAPTATRSAREGALPLGAASTTSPRKPDALTAAREDALPLGGSRHEPATATSRTSHQPSARRAKPDAPSGGTRSARLPSPREPARARPATTGTTGTTARAPNVPRSPRTRKG